MRKVLVLLFAMAAILVLVGCTSSHITHVPAVDGDHQLVGVWEWDDDTNYIYIFNADGSGSRAFAPFIQTFNWAISDHGYLTMRMNALVTELWDYDIVDDVLTIRSRQVSGMQYSYVRTSR